MIVKKVRVTITKEIEVHLTDDMGTEEAIRDWNRGLWPIESVDDIAKYAAEQAATGGEGYNWDGLGILRRLGDARKGDTWFEILDEEYEEEIIHEATSQS
jgi:hypothetical protein